ncbi:hypothetical protein ETAA8_70020 [Anatilimnocola aggregata]|uniref:Uncharacterized protein n=1 Tax=Anatilimnocola aggregata TaxID=2528021 RepID=A0A517YNN4_9BACT|nr:hypothetical protein [Anatilimnocola aggregata]QDU31842.1 hypothetical protein ETAA8_70020 [Anatilimnocola aggregata]
MPAQTLARFVLAMAVVLSPAALGAEGDLQDSVLGKLATQLQPGRWEELQTENWNTEVFKAPQPSKGLDLMGWTDDAHWDPKTGQLLFMGLRQTRQFIAYHAPSNRWRVIPLPADHLAAGSPPQLSKFGHIYSRNAHDAERGHFYHMDHNAGGGIYRFDLTTEKWTKLPEGGSYLMTGVIEFFPPQNWLVNLGEKRDGLRVFDVELQKWQNLGPINVHGYHSLGRHNPLRHEVLFAGGNESKRALTRLTKAGKLENLKEFPEDLNIRFDKLTVDPLSGKYLILRTNEKRLLEYDSDSQQTRLVDDFTTTPWPFGRYDQPIATFVPELGITIWPANSKMQLYKHAAKPAAAE